MKNTKHLQAIPSNNKQYKKQKHKHTNRSVRNLMSALKPSMRFGDMLLTNPSAFEAKDIKIHLKT